MKHLLLKIITVFISIFISFSASAQDFGNISGGFESTIQYYSDKDTLISNAPQDNIASNSYFKLDYNYKNIYAGLQYEAYLPAIQGFPSIFEGNGIANYYLAYKTKMLHVTAGHIYEQFGSGIIFRSWEDRQIGINNAVRGININFNPTDYLRFKAIYGKQRLNLKETGDGIIRGIDAEIDVLKLVSENNTNSITIAGSYLQRYQGYTGPEEGFPTDVNAASGRLGINLKGISFDIEYATKSKDVLENLQNVNMDYYTNYFSGNALLTNIGYSRKGFGFNTTFRRIENMNFISDRNYMSGSSNELSINYLPALTKQQDYSLANIYVYTAQSALKIAGSHPITGEIGGQADIYINFKRGSFLGGKYGTKIALNASIWNGLKSNIDMTNADNPEIEITFFDAGERYYQDINIELRKKWHKRFKSSLTYINGVFNDEVFGIASHEIIKTNIAIADFTFNLSDKNALRLELQHLETKQDKKNWMAGTLEYSIAPKWSFYISDMYNYGNFLITEQFHYYNFGGSYTEGPTRFTLSYGRTRGGLLCVGGVCRFVPASTGFTMTLSSSF